MSLISKIRKTFTDIGIEFYYGTYQMLNKSLDNANFNSDKSVVWCLLLSEMDFKNGIESGNVALFFGRKTDFDFDSIENDEIQNLTKIDAFNWLESVKNGNVLTFSDEKLTYFYDNFAVNTTGVGLKINISETTGLQKCFVKPNTSST